MDSEQLIDDPSDEIDRMLNDEIDHYIFEQESFRDIKSLFAEMDQDGEELTKLFNIALRSGLPSDHLKALEFGDQMTTYYRPYLEEFKKKDLDFDDMIRLDRELSDCGFLLL